MKAAETGHYRKLERMYLAAPVNKFYRPKINISRGSSEIVMKMARKYYHAADAVHGSVYFKALDDSAFFAVNSLVPDVFVLTVNFNIYLTRPISEGLMTAVGNVVHVSRNLFIAESVITDSNNKQIARGNGSFMKSRIRLSPDLGYK